MRSDGVAGDYLPAEVRRLTRYKPWWYVGASLLLLGGGLAVAGALATRDTAQWLAWTGNAFSAAQVTLSLFLVILTYNLFAAASRVTEQNERIHRISQLPIIVAEIEPLSFHPYPSYQVRILNEGSGPALDIDVRFAYRLKEETPDLAPVRDVKEPASDARLRIGVMNKAGHTGKLLVDARGIIMAKPWKDVDVGRDGAPTRAETNVLLGPYSLTVSITYKDIYSQEGRTRYEAFHAAGEVGIDLTELSAPEVRIGSAVRPIAFSRAEAMATVDPR